MALSEIVGTLLMTAATVVILGGFGVLVLQAVSTAGEPPTGDFSLAATPGATTVDVTFLSGSAFKLSDATFGLTVNGVSSLASVDLVSPASPGVFAPGGQLAAHLVGGAPTLAPGTKLLFLASDAATGKAIGITTLTMPGSASDSPLLSNGLTLTGLNFTPTSIPADGAHATTLAVAVHSDLGARLVASVTADLSALGGPSAAALTDDGLGGDVLAGDGVYAAQFAAGVRSFSPGTSSANITIPVVALDGFGHSRTLSGALMLIDPSTLGGGGSEGKFVPGVSIELPPSSDIGSLYVTNFTWHDASALDNDVLVFHVSDLSDYSRTWVAELHYTYSGCSNAPGIASVLLSRDSVQGYATWTPADGCFALLPTSTLQLLAFNQSVGASGMETWTVSLTCPCVAGATPATYGYRAALISANNQGIVTFLGDTSTTADPHGGVPGVGSADLRWTSPTVGGTTWFECPPVVGASSVTSCTNLESDADGQAAATLTESGGGGNKRLDVRFLGNGPTGTGATHTLSITIKDSSNPESLSVKVLTSGSCASGTFGTTLFTVPSTTSTFTTFTTVLTPAQWANGSPCIQLVDAGNDSSTTTWSVDAIKVVTS